MSTGLDNLKLAVRHHEGLVEDNARLTEITANLERQVDVLEEKVAFYTKELDSVTAQRDRYLRQITELSQHLNDARNLLNDIVMRAVKSVEDHLKASESNAGPKALDAVAKALNGGVPAAGQIPSVVAKGPRTNHD